MYRRKLNYAAIRKAAEDKNPDDGRPWFIVRRLLPPVGHEVRLIWPDGWISFGYLTDTGWKNYFSVSHRGRVRDDPPVGWKPQFVQNCGGPPQKLPDPLMFGLRVM